MIRKRQITRLVTGLLALAFALTATSKVDLIPTKASQYPTTVIDWITFPDGSPIPNETEITNQFLSWGVVFLYPPGPPRVLNGTLISGGPTGFFGDIHMTFVDTGFGLPTALTIEIIGSGLDISASLEAFDSNNNSMGSITHTYTGPTGQLSPFTLSVPVGEEIVSAIFNGGLNPNAAAGIGTLIIHYSYSTEVSIDIKPGSDPNSINCSNTSGVIPVAILSTDGFDALTVDHTTVTFEGASELHVKKKTGEAIRHVEDVDLDGDMDLVFHFRLGDTALTCETTEGTLIGETYDGMPIEGSDSIRMIDQDGS